MAVSALKTWAAGEVLFASDLNNEFLNIINNGEDLGWPATKAKDMDGNELVLDGDGDSSILADNDDRVDVKVGGVRLFRFDGTTASCVNGIDFIGAATGTPVQIKAVGTDSNIDVEVRSKGTGDVVLCDDSGNEVLVATDVATAVNEVTVQNAATGADPEVQATGDDTNINLNLVPKGTGQLEIAGVALPDLCRGLLHGLTASNGTDSEHDIDIALGIAVDAGFSRFLRLASAITKQIDANWAEGTNAGGFPSGLGLATGTWYHVFLIGKDGLTTIDAGFDTSLTATNLLSDATGYSTYRRIGSVLTDGSSNILGFLQVGDRFLWDDPTDDVDNQSMSTANDTDYALSVPLGVRVVAIFNVAVNAFSDGSHAYFRTPDTNDEAPSTTVAPLSNTRASDTYMDGVGHQLEIMTDTSSQIAGRGSDAVAIDIATLGWLDRRGRDS
jgi:hypothetical protein